MSRSVPPAGRSVVRLLVVPLLLFAAFSGAAFGLAKLHLAQRGVKSGGAVVLGDAYRGDTVFQQACASCHGSGGSGGGVGPKLVGDRISLAAAKAQIDSGGATMPARVVSGQKEKDVLAYLATILAASK